MGSIAGEQQQHVHWESVRDGDEHALSIRVGRDSQKAGRLIGRWRSVVVAAASVAFVLTGALTWQVFGEAQQSPKATDVPVLRDLAGISELRSLFDRESSKIRIVMLLSPT